MSMNGKYVHTHEHCVWEDKMCPVNNQLVISVNPDCPTSSPRHCIGVEKGFQSGAGTSGEDRDDGEE